MLLKSNSVLSDIETPSQDLTIYSVLTILSMSSWQRITLPEIKQHPWFLKNLPKELIEAEKTNYAAVERDQLQRIEEINKIIDEARTPGQGSKVGGLAVAGPSDSDDVEADLDDEVDVSGDFAGPP